MLSKNPTFVLSQASVLPQRTTAGAAPHPPDCAVIGFCSDICQHILDCSAWIPN